ncbi:MAG TPA: enolase C-terminal domain-like protein [Kofleriaceae bacterium]|nr:enolase C-terminal domain-like protein [Kofleriaceae bacterium]
MATAPIASVEAAAYRIPTDRPEADGTFAWDATTLVVVHTTAGGVRGVGYTYGSPAIVPLVRDELAARIAGRDAMAIEGAWNALVAAVRNLGRPGLAATAISAIDASLWDLKAKLLGLPLVTLLGEVRPRAAVYGSGGFTSYSEAELCEQLAGWAAGGISRVKMKVGSAPHDDAARVAAARRALGDGPELMVDANGAYHRAQAIGLAHAFAPHGVTWFEEPVSSDDVAGLRCVREREPPGMAIAAGEYGWDAFCFRRLLEAGAVDVLQADATRCLGITGFLAAARLCQAFGVPLSAHCAPTLHAHPACAATPLVHVEYFHDHVRLERMLFDGFPSGDGGWLEPDRTRPGLGIELKAADARRYAL